MAVAMDIADRVFITNRDWDPHYLRELVTEDFYDFTEHWKGLSDMELVAAEGSSEARYCPVTEDISLDDDTLYEVVAQIENKYVCLPFICQNTVGLWLSDAKIFEGLFAFSD